MSIEAMKLALEALESIGDQWGFTSKRTVPKRLEAIVALRQAIERAEQANQWQSTADKVQLEKVPAKGGLLPEQEPVAWKDKTYGNLHHQDFGNSIPLFVAPPKREWVVLTDDEIDDCFRESTGDYSFAQNVEAKLKEKNT
jgi:hypothetical protein